MTVPMVALTDEAAHRIAVRALELDTAQRQLQEAERLGQRDQAREYRRTVAQAQAAFDDALAAAKAVGR